MTKEEKKDELKNRISMALKDPILQQGFEIICKNFTEQEEQIADIKANCDLAIEGRDIKIKELEDHLAEEVELHLHAEEYIKSLEQQIEKMKCCANCKSFKGYGETCEGWGEPVLNLNCDCTEWELKE